MCGMCEEACPTYAIQLTPDVEMCEYDRSNMVYEKEHLLISGTGKYHDYNFYRVAGLAVAGKDKGQAAFGASSVATGSRCRLPVFEITRQRGPPGVCSSNGPAKRM